MTKPKNAKQLPKTQDIQIDKISAFFKRSILKSIVKVLTMEHAGFRTFKTVKNINRLFTNIDMTKYKSNPELESYIWCINYFSKQWLDGIVTPELIAEGAKHHPEYDNIKDEIITKCMKDPNIITPPEAKALFDLVSEALQYGYIASLKDQYIDILEDIKLDEPGAYKELAKRLFMISKSLIDIQHNTNLVPSKVTFNTSDIDSVKEAMALTFESLKSSNNMLKTGIRRLNTLLSPAFMNARMYVFMGAPGSGKSVILLKSALDIRKYNPDFVPKTPGMKPCVLYVTMENTFTETIERIWNMTFDDSMTNYTVDEAIDKMCNELGIGKIIGETEVIDVDNGEKHLADLIKEPEKNVSNIEIVMKYFSYREISTDDLFTIIQDLREENMEVCALVFDYIKRINPANRQINDNTKAELSRIMNELKALAVICDIPVVTAHQMNRTAAATMDAATRQGKGDVTKLVGRENVGDAWEVVEVADFLAIVNIAYKPGTDDRYLEVNVVKRRRIDTAESEFAKFTYLAHPFAKNNGLRLLDDVNLDKVLSLQSLSTDIEIAVSKEKTNAVPRLKTMAHSEFDESDDDIYTG